jgi:hypothetical protein
VTATITPALTTVRLPVTLTLLAPLHHGAGTSGNTQLARTQQIVLPDGTTSVVPYVSGNSIRHALRRAGADHLLATIAPEPGSLPKPVVDLLYSGGALTGSGGDIDLATHRRLDELWPAVGLMGYSGKSNIWAGTLYVDHAHLVCADNAWRMPAAYANHPHAALPAAASMGEDFGTRHDIIGTAADQWVAADLWSGQTTQMIYDWQVIQAGHILYTTLYLDAATLGHVVALRTALGVAAIGGRIHLGAKRAQGYGLAALDIDLSSLPDLDAYAETLRDNGSEILTLLGAVS